MPEVGRERDWEMAVNLEEVQRGSLWAYRKVIWKGFEWVGTYLMLVWMKGTCCSVEGGLERNLKEDSIIFLCNLVRGGMSRDGGKNEKWVRRGSELGLENEGKKKKKTDVLVKGVWEA